MPVLEDGDVSIFESGAIVEYIMARHGDGGLKPAVDAALEGREYLVGPFTAADIMLGHSIFMANRLGQVSDEMPNPKGYIGRIESRPAFQKAIQM